MLAHVCILYPGLSMELRAGRTMGCEQTRRPVEEEDGTPAPALIDRMSVKHSFSPHVH